MSSKNKEKIKKLKYKIRVLEHFVKNQNTGAGSKYTFLDAEVDMIINDLDRK